MSSCAAATFAEEVCRWFSLMAIYVMTFKTFPTINSYIRMGPVLIRALSPINSSIFIIIKVSVKHKMN